MTRKAMVRNAAFPLLLFLSVLPFASCVRGDEEANGKDEANAPDVPGRVVEAPVAGWKASRPRKYASGPSLLERQGLQYCDESNTYTLSEYKLLDKSGNAPAGNYGKVEIVEKKGEKFAMKTFTNTKLIQNRKNGPWIERRVDDKKKEVENMQKFGKGCNNVVYLVEDSPCLEGEVAPEQHSIVISLIPGGKDLSTLQGTIRTTPEYRACFDPAGDAPLLRDLAEQLKCIHLNGLVHSDFKDDNIFFQEVPVSGQGGCPITVHLGDFGISDFLDTYQIPFNSDWKAEKHIYTSPHLIQAVFNSRYEFVPPPDPMRLLNKDGDYRVAAEIDWCSLIYMFYKWEFGIQDVADWLVKEGFMKEGLNCGGMGPYRTTWVGHKVPGQQPNNVRKNTFGATLHKQQSIKYELQSHQQVISKHHNYSRMNTFGSGANARASYQIGRYQKASPTKFIKMQPGMNGPTFTKQQSIPFSHQQQVINPHHNLLRANTFGQNQGVMQGQPRKFISKPTYSKVSGPGQYHGQHGSGMSTKFKQDHGARSSSQYGLKSQVINPGLNGHYEQHGVPTKYLNTSFKDNGGFQSKAHVYNDQRGPYKHNQKFHQHIGHIDGRSPSKYDKISHMKAEGQHIVKRIQGIKPYEPYKPSNQHEY